MTLPEKLIQELLFGPLVIFLIGGLMIFFRRRRRDGFRAGYRIGLLGLAALAVLCSYPMVALFSTPLRLMMPDGAEENADIIVVLSSSVTSQGAPTSYSADRAYAGAKLWLAGRAPNILLTGGENKDSLRFAKAMRLIVRGMTVPDASIQVSPGLNTYQEAARGRLQLQEQGVSRVLLVTSWVHIPRAKAVWENQGFEVIPYTRLHREPTDLFSWDNLGVMRRLLHEYGGIVVYKLRGWI